jgi:energy-coupling factor transporter ATP-binding protein EcfA2/predicted ATPase
MADNWTSAWPRGSEWRRWDLQIHTPFSALNNGFGEDLEEYARVLFKAARDREIAVIGVTDYFGIEGYKWLTELRNDDVRLAEVLGDDLAEASKPVLLLPNVELRSREIVRGTDGKDSRVNFHVIFSEELTPSEIEEDFLRQLRFTAQSAPGTTDEELALTPANLEELGRQLKDQHENFRDRSDLFVGMMNAVVGHEAVTRVLEERPSRFKDRYLIVVPSDEDLSEISWDGQGHHVRKLLLQKAHMLFSANERTREFGLGQRHPSPSTFLSEFKSLKPCIHGSDAHSSDELFVSALGRQTWIRANPTFNGLRQLLYEPEERVYIGAEPPSLARIAENSTKYFADVAFTRTGAAIDGEAWFSGAVGLNPGLIAIIGNKGSGKSALADVLGLLGDSRSRRYFSFLRDDRFLRPKAGLGRMFEATGTWRSDEVLTKQLDAATDPAMPERVKYIPQNYLETICTELRETSSTEFDREVEEVIFSHVEPPERLGKQTLQELIDYRTSERESAISLLRSELSDVNRAIVDLEARLTAPFKRAVESELEQRRAELKAHVQAKPKEVDEPPPNGAVDSSAQQELNEAVSAIESFDEEIAAARATLEATQRKIVAADRLMERMDNLAAQVDRFFQESAADAAELGLVAHELISLEAKRSVVVDAQQSAVVARDSARGSLDESVEASVAYRRAAASVRADVARARLDAPNRLYQEYLHRLAVWERRRGEIEGSAGQAESLRGVEARLVALANVPAELQLQRDLRSEILRRIYAVKEQLLADYRELHAPVQDFIQNHPVANEVNALEFTASITIDGFVDGILERVHHGRRGSFQGEREGRERLRSLVANADFETAVGAEAFAEAIEHAFINDLRDATVKAVRIADQLRQGHSVEELYDFVFGLSYLRPRFQLLWRGKPLDQLSPGERGTLLLVFYLLIDRRDLPLMIDQPEENLDNETIALLLVPAVKYAKNRRQIILVTHNPNLAVVCDADQVIHSVIDKVQGNRITYTSGALEDPEITRRVVNVLEGTKPAFDLRDARYEVLERLGSSV